MMKAILCLAFLCCFVAGALAAGCGCDEGMYECACKPANKIIIKAKVDEGPFDSDPPLGNGKYYKITWRNWYKGSDYKFKRLYVSDDCDKILKEGELYVLMGRDNGNFIDGKPVLELHAVNNWVKYFDNMKNNQMKKLRQFRDPNYECWEK